jgi:hypothetical protein
MFLAQSGDHRMGVAVAPVPLFWSPRPINMALCGPQEVEPATAQRPATFVQAKADIPMRQSLDQLRLFPCQGLFP